MKQDREELRKMISHKLPSVNYTADGEMFIWTNELERMARELEADTDEELADDEWVVMAQVLSDRAETAKLDKTW
jgi:hypothetical protein